MPNAPEPKRPDNDDTIGLILGAIVGFVLFTLLGRLIRRPILLVVVVASLSGLYQYSNIQLQRDLEHVTIQVVGTGSDYGDVRSIPVRITNGNHRSARPPDTSLRHRRNRQRVLALQKPRVTPIRA